jgi:hypothetical protein
MAYPQHSTPAPDGAVVPFPGIVPANLEALRFQRWSRDDLPANVVSLRPAPRTIRLPDTPERAFIRALGRQLTPKAYTGVITQLRQQADAGDAYSKAALLMVMDQA